MLLSASNASISGFCRPGTKERRELTRVVKTDQKLSGKSGNRPVKAVPELFLQLDVWPGRKGFRLLK